jgi:hypothetical protein
MRTTVYRHRSLPRWGRKRALTFVFGVAEAASEGYSPPRFTIRRLHVGTLDIARKHVKTYWR